MIARGGLGDDDPVGTGPVVVPPQSARPRRAEGLTTAVKVARRRSKHLVDVDAVVTDFDGVHTDDTAWGDAGIASS